MRVQRGSPPKLSWVSIENFSVKEREALLRARIVDIDVLKKSPRLQRGL
jgi:hypothetical protein